MELYHKITKEVLELLLKEGAQMPVDLARKLERSSSNMQQVREYLSNIGCIFVTKNRNFYELKITDKGTNLLDAMRQMEKLDTQSKAIPIAPIKVETKPQPEIQAPQERPADMGKPIKTTDEVIRRGGRSGILKRF